MGGYRRWRLRAAKVTLGATTSGVLVAATIFGGGSFVAAATEIDVMPEDLVDDIHILEADEKDESETPSDNGEGDEDDPADPVVVDVPNDEVVPEDPVEVASSEDEGTPATGSSEVPAEPAEGASDREDFELLHQIEGEIEEELLETSNITPFAVGVPPENPGNREAKIIVRAGGVRTGGGNSSQDVSPLAGVTYTFYRTTSNSTSGGTQVGECTTDATGECGIIAEIAGGSGSTSRNFYAVATGAPAGWRIPTSWSTGNNYRFNVRVSTGGDTGTRIETLPQAFNSTIDDPTWANVAPNNPRPAQCGIDIAVVVDLSNSVTDSTTLLNQYKAAANGFVDSLTGTPSQIALFTFATNAPANGSNNAGLPLTSVASASSAQTLTNRINGFSATPQNIQGGTNWDRGYHQVAESSQQYDVVLFLTDGAPTFYRNQQGSGSATTIREVNEAIHSANAVKAMPGNPAIIAVGIGPDAMTAAAANRFSLISGPTENVDFFRTEFTELEDELRALATADCGGTVTVVKQLVDEAGNVIDESPGGWEFTATTEGNYLENGSLTSTLVGETDEATGAVNFKVNFASAPTVTRPVTITETEQVGYELVTQNGDNAVCTANGAPVAVQDQGELGFTVGVPPSQVVTCTVQNRQVTLYEELTVEKTATGSYEIDHEWAISKNADATTVNVAGDDTAEVEYTIDVTQVARNFVEGSVDGQITVNNPNTVAMTATVSDTLGGAQCTINATDSDGTTPGLQVSFEPGPTALTYSCDLNAEPTSADGTNTVSLVWDNATYPTTRAHFDDPDNAGTTEKTASAGFTYAVTETAVTVTITDSQYEFDPEWIIAWDSAEGAGHIHSESYTLELDAAPGTCEVINNTAEITETGQESSAAVTVCAGADLEIIKTSAQSFVRSHLWDIEKTAIGDSPFRADPETGEVTVEYSVTVTPGDYLDSEWLMSGTITVNNPNEWQDIPVTVTDEVDLGTDAQCVVTGVVDQPTIVDADSDVAGFQTTIPRDTEWEFTYECSFDAQPDYDGTNLAVVTWDGEAVSTLNSSVEDEILIEDADWFRTILNDSVTITDSNYDFVLPWEMDITDAPETRTYESTWTVGEQGMCESFINIATLTADGTDGYTQSDDATIEACWDLPLTVTKTANASYDRMNYWTIDKSFPEGDHFGRIVDEFGVAEVDYIVTVDHTGTEDMNWTVEGTITVDNPNDHTAIEATVSDTTTITGMICTIDPAADGNPGVAGVQVTVLAGESVDVSYSCAIASLDAEEYTGNSNTATVTWGDESAQSAAVELEFVLDEDIDATVDVYDDKTVPASPELLGSVSTSETLPKEFTYPVEFEAVPDLCVTYTNTTWVDVIGIDPSDELDVRICDQDDLTVVKSVEASFDRDYDWSIEKSARNDRVEVPDDASAPLFTYDVNVVPSAPIDSNFSVTGTIRITNPNDIGDDIVATVNDSMGITGSTCYVAGIGDNPEDADLDLDGYQVVMAPDAVLELDYECAVPDTTNPDGAYTNTVVLTWGQGESISTSEAFTFEVDTVTNESVTVTDTEFPLVDYDDGAQDGNVVNATEGQTTFTYNLAWPTTAGECVDYPNTASVNGVNAAGSPAVLDSSTEVVTVCAGSDLDVEKNVVHSFDRTYLWEIDKAADETVIYADPETGFATADYTVTATPVLAPNGWTDSGWAMSGTITVSNPNEWLDITADVTDAVDVGGGAVCTVSGGEDVLIAAGQTVELGYTCTFTSQPAYVGTNTATATWGDDVPTPNSSVTGTATVEVDGWSQTPINNTIDVVDDKTDPANPVDLGEATWNSDGMATEFTYSLELEGTPGTCVTYDNVAWINQTDQEADASVEVCMDAPLIVSKTAEASYDRLYQWDIDKDVDRTSVTVDEAAGEAEFAYVVTVTADGYTDSNWALTGQITVTNPNDFESVTVSLIDTVDVGGGAVCTIDGGADATIAPSGTAVFDYDCVFATQPDYSGVNTVSVTAGDETVTATADVTFEADVITDQTVDVVDDKTDPANPVTLGTVTWEDSESFEFDYSLTHQGVPGQCVNFTNTAWVSVAGDDPTAEQLVELCVESPLVVDKTVDASFDRTYEWEIVKELADGQAATVSVDESGTAVVDYLITVFYEGYEDSGWDMAGAITVTNPNAYTDIEATVSDTATLDGAVCTVNESADVNDSVDGVQITVPAGGSAVVQYSCELAPVDEADYLGEQTNTATVTWGESGTASSDAVPIYFALDIETNPVVDVYDDHAGMLEDPEYLGPIIYTDDSPTYYEQEITFDGTPGECVTYTNTAWVELTGTNPSDTADVTVCDMTDLEVEKSVTALYNRDYDWTVSKTVDQTEFEIADDGTVTANYTVIADAGEPIDTNKRVAGTITVTNPNTSTGPVMATVEDVSTIVGSQCTILGDDADDLAGFQVILEDGEAAVLDYECIIPAGTDIDADYLNTVTVTWGEDGSAAADAEIVFAIDELTDDEVTITDVMEGRDPEVRDLGTASAGESPKEFTYSEELVGTAGICTDYTNTAIVSEETQGDEGNSSSALVTVCAEAELTVVKTAEGSFTRDYNWAVEKDADETEFYVGEDGTATATYSITAVVEGYVDEDWALSGSITVANPNEYKDMTVSVTDTPGMPGQCVLNGGATTVDVPAGETTTVTYDCTFAQGVAEEDYSGLENLVEITWIDPDGEERSSSGTAPIEFVQTGSIDDTVTVFDDKTVEGEEVELGTVTAEEGTRTFVYDHVLEGTAGSCTVFTNTVIVPEESRQDDNNTASADVTVCMDAPITVDTEFDASFDRDYHWNLAKSVDQESRTVLPGELAEFLYTVTATPLGFTDSGHGLVGVTTIANPNTFKDQLVTVDHTEDFGGLTCTVVGDDVDAEIPGHQVLVPRQDDGVPGQAFVGYACEGAPDNYAGSMTATVDYVDSSEADRSVSSASRGMYEVDEETNKSIVVFDDMTDPEGEPTELGTAHWNEAGTPTEFTYTLELGNPGSQCISYTNTAFYEGDEPVEVRMFGNGVSSAFVLTDDQQADGSIMLLQQTRASVEVEVCVEYPLAVQLEAQADFDRTYLWEIDKSVDRSEVTLDGAGSAEFHYVVAVTPQGFVDSDHSLTGSLTITNPNDHVEPVVTVEQSVSFEGLTCEVITADQDPDMPGVQVLVPAMVDGVDGTAVVEYGCSGEPDDYNGMVTASVAYKDANENDTVVTATNDVAYELDAEVNKTITVLDDKTDPTSDPVILGTADWNEEGIATEFDYTLRFDAVVGETVAYTNTAWIAETEQSDTETVKITADTPIVPITPPAKPVPPAKPTPKPLPPTGVGGSGWLLALGGSVLLLGGGLVFGTNRRRQED